MISKPVRMIDIAEKANVSRMAVSAVLSGTGNGSIRVGAEKRAEINRIAKQLGYRPNLIAQQLAGKKSGIIAVMAGTWFYPVELRFFAWIQEAAKKQGYRILTAQSHGDVTPIRDILHEMESRGVEGFLYLAFNNDEQWPEIKELLQGKAHVVSVLGDLGEGGFSSVLSDVEEGVSLAVQHFIQKGRKKIVIMTENLSTDLNRRRIEGFKKEFKKQGLSFCEDQICIATNQWELETTTEADWDELLNDLINKRGADAILADSDFTAIGLLRAMRRQGIAVPQQVSVIGWGNENIAPVFDPMLTTVSYDMNEITDQAMKVLVNQIESKKDKCDAVTIHVKPKLFIRETS